MYLYNRPTKTATDIVEGTPSADDFAAGYAAGKSAYAQNAQNAQVDIGTGQQAFRKVRNKYGLSWVEGFGAAIDLARGAYNTPPAQTARRLRLAADEAETMGQRFYSLLKANGIRAKYRSNDDWGSFGYGTLGDCSFEASSNDPAVWVSVPEMRFKADPVLALEILDLIKKALNKA